MAYKLDYCYRDLDLEIEEWVCITVYSYEFELEAINPRLKEQMTSFLEYLDIELDRLDEEMLSRILDREFNLK